MARILIVPLGGGRGLAHAGACHTVATGLVGRGHEVIFGYGGDFPELFEHGGHRLIPASEIPADRLPALDKWYEEDGVLESFVKADRELIDREQPDVVISDSRPSVPIAAHDAGVPDIGLCHFLGFTPWSTATRLPGRRWVRRVCHPVLSLGRWWESQSRRRELVRVGGTLNRVVDHVRVAHGLPRIPHALAGGQLVACTSTDLLDPAEAMPANWRYIGHLSWSANGADGDLPELGDKPVVYLTQGSTGRAAALFTAVRALARSPVTVLATTAELCDPAELETLAPNVVAARYLPGQACLERASVAVIHGGHMTASDAHLTGTPVVVIPATADHWTWAARVQRLGTGIPVEGPLLPGRIRRAVSRLLSDDAYRRRMSVVASDLARWDPGANIDALVRELAGA